MTTSECVFCRIIAGEIPANKVYEDEHVLAFLDLRPLNPGHTLVIPKDHYRWVWDVPNHHLFEAVKKVANAIRKAMQTEWVVSLVFGQEVPHAHVWLVPRFSGDGHEGNIDLKNIKHIESEEMVNIAKRIAVEL